MGELRSIEELFAGGIFDHEVILLCVRWYLRYKLSFRDLVEMMAERGLYLAHTTILRWVRSYAPEFIKRWNRFGRSVGRSWRVDETYVKVRGRWVYLYQSWADSGLSAQQQTGRNGSQDLLQESNPAWRAFAARDHSRRLCCVASRSP